MKDEYEMATLERTIVSTAEQRLRELESYLKTGSYDEAVNSLIWLSALIEMAQIQDSGLSEWAIARLNKLESQALIIAGGVTVETKQDELTEVQLKEIQDECRPPWLYEQLDKREAGGLTELPIDLGGEGDAGH